MTNKRRGIFGIAAGMLVALAVLAACSGFEPKIVGSGDYVTTTHRVLWPSDGLKLAKKYCASIDKEPEFIRTEVKTYAVSYYKCVKAE